MSKPNSCKYCAHRFEKIRRSAWFIDASFHEIRSLNKVMTAADAALAKAGGAE